MGTVHPIEAFAQSVRMQGSGSHVIVGPVSLVENGSWNFIEVAVQARLPKPDRPILVLTWNFSIPDEPGGVAGSRPIAFEWSIWAFLADLLQRDFATVERISNRVDFTRAVESRWPCLAATEARLAEEIKWERSCEWERRRAVHIARRTREGVPYAEATFEFVKLNPPDEG